MCEWINRAVKVMRGSCRCHNSLKLHNFQSPVLLLGLEGCLQMLSNDAVTPTGNAGSSGNSGAINK